jgi:hypothetical protein
MKKFFQHFFDLIICESLEALTGTIIPNYFAAPVGVGESKPCECEIHPNFATNAR